MNSQGAGTTQLPPSAMEHDQHIYQGGIMPGVQQESILAVSARLCSETDLQQSAMTQAIIPL